MDESELDHSSNSSDFSESEKSSFDDEEEEARAKAFAKIRRKSIAGFDNCSYDSLDIETIDDYDMVKLDFQYCKACKLLGLNVASFEEPAGDI
jgi:hypothetical protein